MVEMRKRLLAQFRAHRKSAISELFDDLDITLKDRLDGVIAELESRVSALCRNDRRLADTAGILRSVPGIGPVASSTQITKLQELGALTEEEAAALTGLAPVVQDNRTLRGKRAIAGGRLALRHVLFQAAPFASHRNPTLKAYVTALARKLVTISNATCNMRQELEPGHPRSIQLPSGLGCGLREPQVDRQCVSPVA